MIATVRTEVQNRVFHDFSFSTGALALEGEAAGRGVGDGGQAGGGSCRDCVSIRIGIIRSHCQGMSGFHDDLPLFRFFGCDWFWFVSSVDSV